MRPAAGRVVRQKKLSRSSGQQILREDELDSQEYDSLQANYQVETGVEKSEEKEYHLQAALAASGTAASEKDGEIPAPPAEESADIDYDTLYSLAFDKTATYIRFSQTVEECTGCQYDMTTEDDVFLTAYNQKKPAAAKCSEDDFEKIMEIFEETAELQTPYASVDSTVVSFETMKTAIKQELKTEELPGFAKDIYDFWKSRRQDSGNNPLQPTLKFETHQDNDDGDPYVCFRRREVRQTRKTRARDVQSTDRLRKLRTELEEGRKLVALAQHRETMKRNLLNVEKSIYDQRAKVKDAKVRLGIRTDDEDLINQKPQKRKISDHPQIRIPPGGQLRLPGRSDGRPLDADLISLNEVNEQKENSLNRDIENRMQQHQKRNEGQIDLTREPLSPVQGQRPSFRPVETEYHLLTPPSSVNSESFDPLSPAPEKSEGFAFRYSSPPEEDKPQGRPAYRRRIGRCNRLWIDRRGMPSTPRNDDAVVSDRWKYDQDDDDEQPVYEVDPYDIGALKFRATIPLPPHFLPQRTRQEGAAALAARVNGNNPSNVRAIAAAPQSSAPT